MRNTSQINPYGGEEEVILKDVLDLAKKKVQGDHDLSLNLDKYMDLLQRIDISESCSYLALNFAKAAVILEKSTLLYCTKIDLLAILADYMIDALKESAQRKKQKVGSDAQDNDDDDDREDDVVEAQEKSLLKGRRRGRKIKGDIAEEDFFEIDNHKGLAGKPTNEKDEKADSIQVSLFLDEALTLFNKVKRERKPVVLSTTRVEEKEESRLRDWVLTENMMIVREMCKAFVLSDESRFNGTVNDATPEHSFEHRDDWEAPASPGSHLSVPHTPTPLNDGEDIFEAMSRRSSSAYSEEFRVEHARTEGQGECMLDTGLLVPGLPESIEKQRDIPSRKINAGPVTRPQCELCDARKPHKKMRKSKNCLVGKSLGTLDSYFFPFVQPTLGDIQFGVTPDEELFTLYKAELKEVMRLNEQRANVNLDVIKTPLVKGAKFKGFGLEDDRDADDDLRDDGGADHGMDSMHDFELPLPIMDLPPLPPCDDLSSPHPSDFGNIIEELKEDNPQKCMERNKLLGIRTAAWHASLVDKIALSQRRGALNIDTVAGAIMSKFPTRTDEPSSPPQLSFRQLVSGQERKDIPRFFLACLQLTNEGNISIEKSRPNPVDPDCIQLLRLRPTRVRMELEEYTTEPQAGPSRAKTASHEVADKGSNGKKRQRHEESDTEEEGYDQGKLKGKKKQKKGKGIRI